MSDAVRRGMSINNEEEDEEAQAAPLLTDTNPHKIYLSQGLIISGAQLPVIFKSEGLSRVFAELIPLMTSVIVYRCTPKQKLELIEFVHNQPSLERPITAAVGDGSNDVGMLRAADLSFGIQGNSGDHAASSSDYAIT